MKRYIIAGIALTACVALCAAVWPQSDEVEDLPAEQPKLALIAGIGAKPEVTPLILLSADTHTPDPEAIAESEPEETDITSEEKTQEPESTKKHQAPKPSTPATGLRMGDVRVVNGEKQIYILGFGWIKDEGGGSQGKMVGNPDDELTGNKVGQMGGGTTVHGKGDINKQVGIMGTGDAPSANTDSAPGTKKYIDGKLHVWVPGFGWIEYSGKPSVGIVAEDMYENGHKIGSMGGSESPPREAAPTQTPIAQPGLTGNEINIVFVEVSEKNSTPPQYKPGTTSP